MLKIKILIKNKYLYFAVIFIAFVLFILLFRINSLPNGINAIEAANLKLKLGWHGIFNQPLNLPINFLRSLDYKIFQPISSLLLIRLPNLILGFIAIIEFSVVIFLWYGKKTIIFGSLIFASSAYILHISRFASNDVEYLFGMTTLLLISALLRLDIKNYVLYLMGLGLSIMLFIPGFIWLVIIILIFNRADITELFKALNKPYQKLLTVLAFLLPLVLLIQAFMKYPRYLTFWLGYQSNQAFNITAILKNILKVGADLVIQGPNQPSIWLGRLPILDIFGITMTLIGLYFYIKHFKSPRSKLLLSLLLGSVLVIGVGNVLSIAALIPVIFIILVAGISYCMHRWLKYFPKNKVMRGFGYSLIGIAVLLSITFNLRTYYIAWASDPATKTSFNISS